ncbi:unnamed protein product [Periconia digitata]|uniref:Uncharacterized protein n=1 Tax=Periconia digitata TaxID=1303443 RepID=A0A9W4XMV7_9PLEO|nr:unnamed protein product [Periconia digitata]
MAPKYLATRRLTSTVHSAHACLFRPHTEVHVISAPKHTGKNHILCPIEERRVRASQRSLSQSIYLHTLDSRSRESTHPFASTCGSRGLCSRLTVIFVSAA